MADGDAETADERRQRGADKIAEVYAGNVPVLSKGEMPFYDVMLDTIFAGVWDRPELSVRDRRLLVMGAVAASGSTHTWRVLAKAALDNGDLTPEQLRECIIQLAPYAGYPNVADIAGLTEEIINDHAAGPGGEA